MEKWIWFFVIVMSILSIIGSVLIVLYVLGKQRRRQEKLGISVPKRNDSGRNTTQGRKWNGIITVYLLLCLVFIIIILFQSGMENRDLFDILAVPVGAVFFLIQAIPTRNKAVRRKRANILTTATLAKLDEDSGTDQSSYDSVFEFYAQEKTYRVRNTGYFKKKIGSQVELYYAPDDPNVIYVPELEKLKSKIFPAIILLYGILFPLVGLLAPLFR